MDITKFIEKFNRIDGNIYTIEELVTPVDGVYEAELIHDNVELKTINVYTGPKLTGTKINTISFSTPSLTPWKTVIKIFSTEPKLYITYETTGDTIEAEDINKLQDALNLTQEELNKETNRATNRENLIENNLTAEIKRSTDSENNIIKNLEAESNRAKKREEELNSNINTTNINLKNEVNRSTEAEKTISDNLLSETNRATNAESTLSTNLNKEIDRAKAKENSVEDNINNYKTTNNAEIQGLKAKDIDLDNKKANLDYVNLELNKRYTKDQTFTRDEVLKKIQDLIGTAPDTLDTFKEIADALGNDPNFATTIMNELSSKVDKVVGKSLSTNDYDNTEKTKLADVNAKKHEHSNKSIIDKITQGLLDAWNSAYNHIGDSIRHITSSERNLWNTVSDKANKIDIPNKLSQLTNDKKFITQDDIDTSQNHIHNNKSVLDKINQETLDDINLSADKVLKNESTPIKTDSTLTKLSDCAGGYVRNMQIKGKTLQNLWNNENVVSLKNDAMLIQTISTDDFRTNMLKDNIEYSIVNLSNKKTRADITTKNSNAYVKTLYIEPHSIQKFTISSQYISSFYGLISEGWTNTDSDKDIFKKACMILEGDYTNKEIPSYFEGIKSVGELDGNKISILTKGKNLYNSEKYPLSQGWISQTTGYVNNADIEWLKTNDFIPILPNTKYNLKIDIPSGNNPGYALYNKNEEFIVGGKNGIFTTPSNVSYLRFTINPSNKDNVMLLHGNETNLDYEPCKVDKTEILLPSPHMGIGDVQDIINFDKNERIKNVCKDIWNGNEDWIVSSSVDSEIVFQSLFSKSKTTSSSKGEVIFNKNLKIVSFTETNIFARIDKSQLSTPDANGFKKLLKSWADAGTPLEIYYQLATPVIEKLNIKDTLQSFENGYLQLDNSITPSTHLEYSTNLPSIISGVVEIQDKLIDRVNILEKKKSITWNELEGI